MNVTLDKQANRVLEHLQTAGSITNVEANAVLKVRSVSRRMTDIIRAGYPIRKETRFDSEGQRYVRYIYEKAIAKARADTWPPVAGQKVYAIYDIDQAKRGYPEWRVGVVVQCGLCFYHVEFAGDRAFEFRCRNLSELRPLNG